MKTERWFKVLVLGGAMVGEACGTVQEGRPNRRPGGTGGSTAGSGGERSPGDGAAGTGGSSAGSGGVSLPGAGGADGSAAGGAPPGASGAASSGAASSGDSGSGGAGAAGGLGGSGGQLECRIDASGHGDSRDPCGCPCCWAKDCLNTDTCCGGFCRAGDDGRGCCPQ
jgi:hypothetical protein